MHLYKMIGEVNFGKLVDEYRKKKSKDPDNIKRWANDKVQWIYKICNFKGVLTGSKLIEIIETEGKFW